MVSKDSEKLSGNLLSTKIKKAKPPTCSKCGSTRIIIDDSEQAEIACMDCGFVSQQKNTIEKETEWQKDNTIEPAINLRQTGMSLTHAGHDKGLSTVIDKQRQKNYDQNLTGQKVHSYRLRKWQRRIRVSNSTECNFVFALSEITKMSNNLGLPKNVLETALFIYRKNVEEHLVSGRSVQSVASATLYLACKQWGLPKTLDAIVQVSAVSKKEVGRSYRCLIKGLGYSMPLFLSDQGVTEFFGRLGVRGKTEEIAHRILSVVKEGNLTTRYDLAGVTAAIGYVALVLTGERRSMKDVADTAQVTEATVRKCYEELEKQLMLKISM